MKRTGGGEGGWGQGGFETNTDALGSFPCLDLLGGLLTSPNAAIFTQLTQQKLLYSTVVQESFLV